MFDYEGSRSEFLKILVEMGEEPAFLMRARRVEEALSSLVKRCESERRDALIWPRRHFHVLRKRCSGNWSRFAPLVSDPDSSTIFVDLSAQLPEDDKYLEAWFTSDRSALRTFHESATKFNKMWSRFLSSGVLTEVNDRRREYNSYYPMEKATAFGTESFSADFKALPEIPQSWLESRFPLLTLPQPI